MSKCRIDFLTGLTALFLAGCSHHDAPSGAAQMAAPKVTVAPVIEKSVVEWREFTGRTEAIETVEVKPRVSGHIQEIHFQSGQLVKKGDLLFKIDPRWHQAEFDQREAEYAQAKSRLETSEREAKRTSQLLASKAISTEEAEARQSRFNEAKAGLLAAEAARNFSRLDLDFTEIRSPIDGRVSRALVTPGNFVSGLAGNGTLLTTIVTVDPVYVYANFDEQSLLKFNELIRSNALASDSGKVPVELALGNEEGYPHRGTVESLDNRLDAATGSILLRALFPNSDGTILPGLFARIRVPLSTEYPALMISEGAIGTDQAQKFVLALTSSNTVDYRTVKLGPSIDGLRVIRSGVKKGDQVVVNGLQRARPGMPVTPERSAPLEEKGIAQR